MTTKPVIAGTDGSAGSMRAVEWAAEFAPDLAIDTRLLTGPAAVAVTDCGKDAGLLVVGSHGAGAFTAMVLGSVSRFAAIHAACPVVVVREETMAAHRQIVVGIRDIRECASALAFAFEEAAMRKASLLAVHAWHAPVSSGSAPVPAAPFYQAESDAAERLSGLLAAWRSRYPEVTADQDVVHGHPGRVLAGYSARADLVVLGRHGEHGVAGVTHTVLSHAHGPVAIMPSA